MKKGFTLIELLAVIIILGIIALIAVPIIVNVIDNAEKESVERSTELYIRAVDIEVMNKNLTEKFKNGTCQVQSNGYLNCDGTTIEVVVNNAPKSGTVTVENRKVVSVKNLEIGNGFCNMSNNKVTCSNEKPEPIAKLESENAGELGAKYSVKVNDTDTFYFYVIGTNTDGTTNLIMDRSICNDGTTTYTLSNNYCRYAWYSAAKNNTYGPTTVMAELYNATKNWTNVLDMKMDYTDENNIGSTTYGYTSIITSDGVTTITGKPAGNKTTIGTSAKPLKARLPKESEVTGAGCTTGAGSCPVWLIENMKYYNVSNDKYSMNNNTEAYQYILGYWLLPSHPSFATSSRVVNYDGYVGSGKTSDANFGIRPVITLDLN